MLDTIAKTAVVSSMLSLFRRSRRNDTNYIAAAGLVCAGVVIGAGAALMFAPKSGAELRADVRQRARRLSSGAQKRFERARDAAASEIETH